MKEKELIVKKELISTKEAAQLVQIAMQYRSSLCISYQSYQVNLKSMMGVLCLGLRAGERITISAEGDDEDTAVSRLEKYLS